MTTSRATSTIALPRAPTQYDQRDEQTARRSIEQAIEDLRLAVTENRDVLTKPASLALRRFEFMALSGFGNNLASSIEHNVWARAQGTGITTLTDAASVSWDMAPGNVYELTLGGNRTMSAPTNVKPGYTYLLFLVQDGTGSRTVSWNGVFKWAGGSAPTLSTAAGAVDVLSFVARSTSAIYGSLGIAAGA